MCEFLDKLEARGVEKGRDEGIKEGVSEGIKGMIIENLDERTPVDRIVFKLEKYFGLSEKEARIRIDNEMKAIA